MIVAGARRYRAAQIAEAATVPVRIVNLTDAEALEAALVENLIRSDVHPMEEANGFFALLALEEPKYTIEQIAARTGKSAVFVASRLRLTELTPVIVEAFYREEIGVGHALLLARLQPTQQEQALPNCFREDWGGGSGKAKRILLPVRHLQHWIVNSSVTAHDGVFAVRQLDIEAYMLRYEPQTLRYNRLTRDVPGTPINYGAAKGMTFNRTLLFPNLKLRKFLLSGGCGITEHSRIARLGACRCRAATGTLVVCF